MKRAFQKKVLQALTSIKTIDLWKFEKKGTVLIKIEKKLKENKMFYGAFTLFTVKTEVESKCFYDRDALKYRAVTKTLKSMKGNYILSLIIQHIFAKHDI